MPEPTVPTFGWFDQAPAHLKTRNQLAALGLRPGGPVAARVVWRNGRRSADLYDQAAAKPKRTPPTRRRPPSRAPGKRAAPVPAAARSTSTCCRRAGPSTTAAGASSCAPRKTAPQHARRPPRLDPLRRRACKPARWCCTMDLYAADVGEPGPKDFGGVGDYRFQPLPGGDHTALGDARATLALLRAMAARA